MARARIRDIAEEAGVSQATVSRYLNRHYDAMSPATRERIAAVIKRTGYRPSSVARGLRLDRSGVLGLVLADIQNPYSSAMLEAIDARAASRGLSIMTAVSENDPEREAQAIDRLVDARVDGLIVNTCGGNEALIASVAAATPVVLLDRALTGTDASLDLVTSNNAELVRGLMDELEHGGARACVLVTEPGDASSIRRERAEVFERELAARGLPGTVTSLPASPVHAAAHLRETVDRVRQEVRKDANTDGAAVGLIAVNGLVLLALVEALAAGANAALTGTGAALTGDDAPRPLLATFDDYAWNRVLFGGITTAVQDTGAIADAVLERLAARIGAHEAAPVRIEVPGSIVRRATTAPHGRA